MTHPRTEAHSFSGVALLLYALLNLARRRGRIARPEQLRLL